MIVIIDITGLPADGGAPGSSEAERWKRVSVVPSPPAELGMALHALSEPGHHPRLQGRRATAVSTRLDRGLADRLCEADFLWRTTFSDVFAPLAGIPPASAVAPRRQPWPVAQLWPGASATPRGASRSPARQPRPEAPATAQRVSHSPARQPWPPARTSPVS